ncbi:MAG: hypothetical protein DRP12_00355 [Candidatus Aenigmatarchaeota archaeon]|nr:MAG: hypothetical protein DRP12_00355 [Candidatus Aenigmarchaeota archaeon]
MLLEIFLTLILFSILSAFLSGRWLKIVVGLSCIFMLSVLFPLLSLDFSSEYFIFDPLSRLYIFLLFSISPWILLYSLKYIETNQNRFFSIIFIFIASMYGFVISNNIIFFFILWKLISVCSFLLISFDYRDPEAVRAGKKCFILTQVGEIFVLIALIFLAIESGTMVITQILRSALPFWSLFWPALFLMLGALAKSSIFPFSWLPDAMKAPSPVSALLHSATMVNAGLYVLFRFLPIIGFFWLFPFIIVILSFFTLLCACLNALGETNIKRILAYSTQANLAIIFATLCLMTADAEAAGFFHLLNHAYFKAGLFLFIGIIIHKSRKLHLQHLRGSARHLGKMKYGLLFLILAACSLPPSNGFLSKWAIYTEWLHVQPLGLILLVFSSILTIAYYGRMVSVLFQEERAEGLEKTYTFSLSPFVILCLLFGVTTLGYTFFVKPIVHPVLALHSDLSLLLVLLSLFGLLLIFRSKVDPTGPFTGGEELSIRMPEIGMRTVQLDLDRFYGWFSCLNRIPETLSLLEYKLGRKWLQIILLLALLFFLILL